MSTGRLTRQEIGWLLAQEARGAAKILRKDVTRLTQSSFPAPPTRAPAAPPVTPEIHLETTLDALDDAIGMLSELQTGAAKASRRGRIDVAALLCELNPRANIALEPGAGTEVFGDEAELRRMLYVLTGQASASVAPADPTTTAVRVRREGDFVRVTAELGPDASSSTEIERRWLSRMATRSGGRLELEGGTVSVLLPADPSMDQTEVSDLRRELEQARELGATYARELARVFAAGLPETAPVTDARDVANRRFQLLTACARAMHRPLYAVFRAIEEELRRLPSDKSAPVLAIADAGLDLVSQLGHVAACPDSEPVETFDLGAVIREGLVHAEARAARQGVEIASDVGSGFLVAARANALTLVIRCLLEQAIDATPKRGRVWVSIRNDRGDVVASFSDGGPVVPAAFGSDLLEHRVDPASHGRPPGIGLLAASVTAAYLGARLSLKESAGTGAVAQTVEVRFEPGETRSK